MLKTPRLPTVAEMNAAYRPIGSGAVAPTPEAPDDCNGFLAGFTPMQAGKARKALAVSMIHREECLTRRQIVEARVASGSVVDARRRLIAPDGSYLEERQITATAMDYAVWLSTTTTTTNNGD